MDKVSIVVPVYNAEKYITDCIESLLIQSFCNLQIILVDDGSTDSSGNICDKYAEKDKRIEVYHRCNSGVSSTRNYGIDKADGSYIMFVDSDDKLHPNAVEDNLRMINRYSADVVIFSYNYCVLDENKVKANVIPEFYEGNAEEFFKKTFNLLIDKELINPPWNKIIRLSLLKEHNIHFNQEFSICEDMAFTVQVLRYAEKLVLNNGVYYDYNIKSTGSLVFGFYSNYYEALSYFYMQAMTYCNRFINNECQVKRLNKLYAELIIMYIKQICCKSGWNRKKCIDKMKNILRNKDVSNAISSADLGAKKKVVRILIRVRQYWIIYLMYSMSRK